MRREYVQSFSGWGEALAGVGVVLLSTGIHFHIHFQVDLAVLS